MHCRLVCKIIINLIIIGYSGVLAGRGGCLTSSIGKQFKIRIEFYKNNCNYTFGPPPLKQILCTLLIGCIPLDHWAIDARHIIIDILWCTKAKVSPYRETTYFIPPIFTFITILHTRTRGILK